MRASLKLTEKVIEATAVQMLALIFLVAVFGVSCSTKRDGERPVGEVKRGELVQKVTVSGRIVPKRKSLVTAPYAGYVRKLYVKIGDVVHEGDPLVTVTQSLRTQEESHPLRAPFTGVVVQVLKSEGEYLPAGTGGSDNSSATILRVDDLSQLQVEADAPELEFPKLKAGQPVSIRATAVQEQAFKGKVLSISLASKEQTGWERSRVEFPFSIEVLDHDPRLRPGMSVIVDIEAMKFPGVLMLKHEFVEKAGEKYFVTLEAGEKRDIKVGIQNEEVFEIQTGLKEGDRVRPVVF